MELINKVRSGFEKGVQTVSNSSNRVIHKTGEVLASDTTQRVVDVAVDGLSDVFFSPAEKVVDRVGQIAKVTQSPTLKTAHKITNVVVEGSRQAVSTAAKVLLSKITKFSGKKLTALSGPTDTKKK